MVPSKYSTFDTFVLTFTSFLTCYFLYSIRLQVFNIVSQRCKRAKKQALPTLLNEIYGKGRANSNGATNLQEEENVIRAKFHCLDDDEILPNEELDGIEASSTQEHRTPTNRTKGTKRQKITSGFNASLGDMASSLKKFVECIDANLDKLTNGLY